MGEVMIWIWIVAGLALGTALWWNSIRPRGWTKILLDNEKTARPPKEWEWMPSVGALFDVKCQFCDNPTHGFYTHGRINDSFHRCGRRKCIRASQKRMAETPEPDPIRPNIAMCDCYQPRVRPKSTVCRRCRRPCSQERWLVQMKREGRIIHGARRKKDLRQAGDTIYHVDKKTGAWRRLGKAKALAKETAPK